MTRYYDTSSVIQVIGSIYKNPSLLDMEDKYSFNEEDFNGEEFHKVIFGSIYNLHQLGAEEITPATINDYLESKPKKHAIYKVNDGEKYLTNIASIAQPAAFDYYYSRLKKMTLLREYNRIGVDVSDFYDDENIFDTKKRQFEEERLDHTDITEIANIIDKKVSEVRLKYAENTGNDFSHAGEGILNLIQKLKDSPDFGYPLYGEKINSICRGARLGKLYLRSAGTGVGKALPNYTPIPTPYGMRTVGDIRVGDYLIGQNGEPTKVLAIYPQEEKKNIWKVKFKSGKVAECCEDHLWGYYDGVSDVMKVKSTKEIYNSKGRHLIPLIKRENIEEEDTMGYLVATLFFYGYVDRKSGEFCYPYLENEQIKNEIIKEASLNGYLVKFNKEYITVDLNAKYDEILEIIPTEEKAEMTCFTVDNENHLFVAGDQWWVTHNTRTFVADAATIACSHIYNKDTMEWEYTGKPQPALFIATEQDEEEIQTMLLAFLSGVNEKHIVSNLYTKEESDRLLKAAEIIENSKLIIKKLPDFSLQDIENSIKYAIREHECKYVFFDYIHSSMKILDTIGRDKREDLVLFLISARLKDICNKYNIFIYTGTQLNGDFKTATVYDQALLRGSKAIADKVDFGSVMLDVTEADREKISPIVEKLKFKEPNVKMSIYKNRRGDNNGILLWMDADKGACRFNPIFATNYRFELVEIDDVIIKFKEDMEDGKI